MKKHNHLFIIILFTIPLLLHAAPKSWKQLADDAIRNRDCETAAAYYHKWTEADPNDAGALYNLACCEALLDHPEAALQALHMAVEAGWKDSVHTAADSDLESLRDHTEFAALLTKIANNARAERHYIRHWTLQERYGDYLIELPADYDSTSRYSLAILLHGYGDSPEHFEKLASAVGTKSFIWAIPRGAYLARDTDGKGFSHERERSSRADTMRGLPQAVDWVLTVADDVRKRYPIQTEKFWMVGFSQGAALCHTVATRHPERVAGYCSHAGYFTTDAVNTEQLIEMGKTGIKVLISHGTQDPVIPFEDGLDVFKQLQDAGVDVSMQQFDIGHRLPADVGVKIGEWLEASIN